MEQNVNKACFCWHLTSIIDFYSLLKRTRNKGLFNTTSSHETHRRTVPQPRTFDATTTSGHLRQSRLLCFASVSLVRIQWSLSTSSEHATTLFHSYYFPLVAASAAAATSSRTLACIRYEHSSLFSWCCACFCICASVCVVCFHSHKNHMIMASSSLKLIRFTSKILRDGKHYSQ